MTNLKTKEEINIMAEGGKILATVLNKVAAMTQPGITTMELDRAAEALILQHGAKPAFKGYEKFPYTLCTSVNDVLVHGLPSHYVLKEGDIIGLDLGVLYKDYNTDMAVTVAVGEVSFQAKRLLDITKKALRLAIKKTRAGITTGDIGNTVQRFVEDQGFNVARELYGHGIGTEIHEEPNIPNFGQRHKGTELKEGMVICIEPMVMTGGSDIKQAPDRYGIATKDGSLAAHFEHTLAITQDGCRVLTVVD